MDTKSSNKIKTSAETQRGYLIGKYLQGKRDNALQLGPGGSGILPQGTWQFWHTTTGSW
jgi:hypothetical protein